MARPEHHFPPHTTRSRLVLEVASELSGTRDWPYPQVRVTFREPGTDTWKACFFASDTPETIDEVARGEVQIALINPVGPLALAYRGTGPFKEPIPLRAVTVVPSPDQLGFAVAERTGLKSLEEIRDRRYPLRISFRRQLIHSVPFVVKQVLAELGFSLDDIVSWGGKLLYDRTFGDVGNWTAGVRRGEVDAIFDEAINTWGNQVAPSGMRFLPLSEPHLKRIEALGFRRAVIPKAKYPTLPADVATVDFSGWAVYTLASVPDGIIKSFCTALVKRKDRIPWEEEGPLPLERMCRDTPEGPMPIPLHPAAERFWREQGYLK